MMGSPVARVLVADDEQSAQVVAQWAMRSGPDMGCEVELTVCGQGDEAALAVESGCAEGHPYAAVFLDYAMPPGPDGLETSQRIRRTDANVNIVVVTGRREVDPRAIAEQVGPPDRLFFLRKPVHPDELRQLCVVLVNRWRAEQAAAQAHAWLEQQVAERTRDLREANEQLSREIEERRAAESDLMIARFSLEHAPDAIVWVEADGRVTFANAYACECLRYPLGELLSQRIWDIEPALDEQSWAKHFADLRASGAHFCETLLRRKDGSMFPVDHSAVSLDYEGRTCAMAFIRDVTPRRLAEAEHERFRTAVTESEEMVVVLSADQRIQFANPACEYVTGYSSKELVKHLPPFLREGSADEEMQQAVVDALNSAGRWVGRVAGRRKDGAHLDLDVTVSLVRDAAEQTIGYVLVGHEVNEVQDLKRRLRRSQRLEAIGTLAGGMAHDFNNVLAAIQGYTELTLTNLPDDSRGADYLNRSLQAVRRARDLVAQILSFARSEDEARRPLHVHLIVNEAVKLLRAILPTTVEIQARINKESGAVLADPGLIHQILLNMCTNAYQAMPDGKGTLRVTLDTCTDGRTPEAEWVRLVVEDDGVGIPPDVQDRIFEPFFTTKTDGRGTGMGLATVHSVVVSHGGTVSVRTAPGEGATFTVLLPRHDAAPAAEEPDLPMAAGGGIRVLLVDDEPMLSSMLGEALSLSGYLVSTFTDPRAALAAFEAAPVTFDVLVTDVTMPHLPGDELARRVLAVRPDLPVVLISGSGDRISRGEALAMGCAEYMMKPVGPRVLTRALAKVVRARRGPVAPDDEETRP